MNLVSPYIRLAIRSRLSPRQTIRRRVILDYELIYLERGEWKLIYDKKEYLCREGDFIFLRPGVSHSIHTLGCEVSQPHIHFDLCYSPADSERRYICFDDISRLSDESRGLIHRDIIKAPHSPVISGGNEELKELMFSIIDSKGRDARAFLERKAAMTRIAGMLLSLHGEAAEPARTDNISSLIKRYIDSNVRSRITLQSLEQQFHYNRFYIEKRFIADYGMGISEYYNRLRLNAVREYLLRGHTVSETAERFRFDSIYSFSRWFKAKNGTTAREYIKKNNGQ